jgi:O-antigen ligase
MASRLTSGAPPATGTRTAWRSARDARTALGAVLAIGLGVAVVTGVLVAPHEQLALLLGAAGFGAGVAVVDPVLLPVVALPATLLVQRLGGGAAGSSVDLSDVVLALASVIALTLVPWEQARALSTVVGYALLYESVLLVSVVYNTNSHSVVEWVHRLVLVAGAMITGWVVASNGRAPQAIRWLLVGSTVLALDALKHALTLHFEAAQWGAYQKNYIGSMMWMTVVIAHLDPPWAAIPPRLGRVAKYFCLAGLMASQSKQGIIALVVVVVIATLRQRSLRRRSKIILLAVAPLAVFAYVVAAAEVAKYRRHGHNSLTERTVAYSAALDVWRLDPWLGQGPRWWYLARFAGNIQPPNILLEALTESGILGSLALVALLACSVALLAKLPRDIATVGLVLIVGRAVEGIFDLYWVSASGALPWLVVGCCLGAADTAARRRAVP